MVPILANWTACLVWILYWKTRTSSSCRQYNGCWWLGDAKNQGISSHGINLIFPEISSHSMRRVNILIPQAPFGRYKILKNISLIKGKWLSKWCPKDELKTKSDGATTWQTTIQVLTWPKHPNFTTLRLRQNGRHFLDDIFKCIFLNENVWISIKISLKFVPKGPINNIPALVQIMAWRRTGNKPLYGPCNDG